VIHWTSDLQQLSQVHSSIVSLSRSQARYQDLLLQDKEQNQDSGLQDQDQDLEFWISWEDNHGPGNMLGLWQRAVCLGSRRSAPWHL